MSLPQTFVIAVISGRFNHKTKVAVAGDLAATAAAILVGPNAGQDFSPTIFPVAVHESQRKLVDYGRTRGLELVRQPLSPQLLNPRQIHVWLALDKEGAMDAKQAIARAGPPPGGFYRQVFPSPVLRTGFVVPDSPRESDFDAWFNEMQKLFLPWKERFWKAYYESS